MIAIPSFLTTRAFLGLAVAAVGFAAGWGVNGWRLESQVAAAERAHAEDREQAQAATVRQRDEAIAARDILAAALAGVDAKGSDEIRRLTNENEILRRAGGPASPSVVRVRGAVCPPAAAASLPKAVASGGVDSGEGTILDAQARQDFFDIRADAIRVAGKLDACQAALGCITGQGACP